VAKRKLKYVSNEVVWLERAERERACRRVRIDSKSLSAVRYRAAGKKDVLEPRRNMLEWWSNLKAESGIDCLMCAKFGRQLIGVLGRARKRVRPWVPRCAEAPF
jgi:hypothetical protein